MLTDTGRLLEQVRELVRWNIYPVRQRLSALGIANVVGGRFSAEEIMECLILVERLLAENTRLIHMLGIAEFVGEVQPGDCRDVDSIRMAAPSLDASLSRVK